MIIIQLKPWQYKLGTEYIAKYWAGETVAEIQHINEFVAGLPK